MDINTFFSRRNFIKLCGGAFLMLGTGCGFRNPINALTSEQTKIDAGASHIRQMIATDNQTARTIMWHTEKSQEQASLEYRRKGSNSVQAATAAQESFTDDSQTVFIHTAELKDLNPGSDYEYRTKSPDGTSEWYPLQTENGDSFTALIFPDSQSNDYTDWKNLFQAATKANPKAAFFVNMGDLVDNGEDRHQWKSWLDAVNEVNQSIPFAPVMGNHETYTLDWKVRLPEAYLHYFKVPQNDSKTFDRYYYSFDYGPVHFIVLNTQMDETNEFKPNLLDEQLAWLEQDIQSTTKKWKVVMMHRDVITYAIKGRPNRIPGIADIGEIFMPLFDRYSIDLVFTAHLHTYRNRGRLYNLQPADNKGPAYILTGVAGNVRYPDLWIDHEFDKKIAPQPETDNYLTLQASTDELKINCYLPDGTVIDEMVLKK